MGYMIEGGGSKTYSNTKKWLYTHEDKAHKLLKILTDVIIDYLVLQIRSGAQLVQVFESSAEYLNSHLFEKFCSPYLLRISTEVKKKLQETNIPAVPMVCRLFQNKIIF